LTELFNICRFKQASLYVAFTFFVSTTTSFHFVSKNVLETELGEALNDKEIYLKSDRGTQLVNPVEPLYDIRLEGGDLLVKVNDC